MKAGILITLFICLRVCSVSGQILAGDAKGESSVILNASSIGFNLSDATLSANWNNFRNLAIEKPQQLIWGISVSGGNNEGLSDLFSGGHFTPRSNLRGFIGLRKSFQESTFEMLKRIRQIQESKDFPNAEAIAAVKSLNEKIRNVRAVSSTKALTTYVDFGLNADRFKSYAETEGTSLASRFGNVNFRGGFVSLGANYEYGRRWTFGLSAGYERFNNLDSLALTEFKLSSVIQQGNEQLSRETKYQAYRGDYFSYNRATIKSDVLYFARVNDDYRLVWNTLYTRWLLPFGEDRVRMAIRSGTAINFYKSEGKFAGGVYLQSDDTFNHMDAVDKFHERLSFGITARYTFGSILSRDFP